jgi:ubiquinone/menaquinone biosynthesis C-methylase UbiE
MVNKKSSSLAQLKKSFTKAKTAFSRLGFWKTRFETPTPPSYKKRIYTQNLNYFSVANQSIWGEGDPDTISYLNSLSFSHKLILNVCAGDGRYNNLLLSKGARVVASDIDKSALAKLWHLTPKSDRLKLSIRSFDINKKFPFPNKFFDVVFCTGILHLFPSDFLEKHIFWEFKRVVKNKGRKCPSHPKGGLAWHLFLLLLRLFDYVKNYFMMLYTGCEMKILQFCSTPKYSL